MEASKDFQESQDEMYVAGKPSLGLRMLESNSEIHPPVSSGIKRHVPPLCGSHGFFETVYHVLQAGLKLTV